MPWYPKAERLPISTGEFGSRGEFAPLAIVEHVTDGTDSRNHLQNVANDSSVHFLIRKDGKVYQFMDTDLKAWGNGIEVFASLSDATPVWLRHWCEEHRRGPSFPGDPNLITISVEHEATMKAAPFDGFTTAQIQASKDLNRWLIATHPTIKPDREHIIGHYQIQNLDRQFCPGGANGHLFPFGEIVAAAQPAVVTETLLGGVDVHPDAICRAVADAGGSFSAARPVAEALCHFSSLYGLCTSIVAGQVLHETNYLRFTGDVSRSLNNLAGIRSADGSGYHQFASVDDGAEAVCQHHLGYILGKQDRWPHPASGRAVVDPRLAAVLATDFAGTVKHLSDYGGGKWAEDPEYAPKIARKVRAIRDLQRETTWDSLYFPSTRAFIRAGFRTFYQHLGDDALRTLGMPLRDESDIDLGGPRRVQCFERAVLGYYPEFLAPWDIVCLQVNDAVKAYQQLGLA
jgi:hypothetical protein